MISSLTNREFLLFRKYINEKCGIDIQNGKAYLIETRLAKILADSGLSSFEELYFMLMRNTDYHISEKVIDAITTNETYWFRDKTPWNILESVLMPKFIQMLRTGEKQKIRIWSAAASTGQEPYSTAMSIHTWLERNGIKDIGLQDFEILATDISHTVLEIAKKGRYDAMSVMRGLDTLYRDKYFKKDGMTWIIDDRIKTTVRFQQFNLQSSFLLLGKFDIVFCRYVLIYFADSLKAELANKLSNIMEKESALFIGASELYEELRELFEMIHSNNGTYYKKRGGSNNENSYS